MASVFELRRLLARRIRASLPDKQRIVVGPDHPFLLRSADLLIEGNELLAAAFIPTSVERKRPELLIGRLILNRLALPANTLCFLVIEHSDDTIREEYSSDFTEAISFRQTHRISAILRGSKSPTSYKPVPLEIQTLAHHAFVDALELTEEVAATTLSGFDVERNNVWDSTADLFQRKSDRRRAARRLVSEKVPNLAEDIPVETFSQGEIRSASLVSVFSEQIRRLYSIQAGVLRPSNEKTGVLFVHSFPVQREDPRKVIRAAAFAGWTMLLQDRRHMLSDLMNRLRSIRRAPQ